MNCKQQNIPTDREGFLLHLDDWDQAVALSIAKKEGIVLTDDHWSIIHFLRHFYLEYKLTPAVRILVKEMTKQVGAEKGNSLYCHQLFPGGVIKQGSKIAGLPKPKRCI